MNQADTSEDTQKPEDEAAAEQTMDAVAESAEEDAAVEASAAEAEGSETPTKSDAPAPPPPAPPPPAPTVPDKYNEGGPTFPEGKMDWYILKVAFNREDSIADALRKRVKMEGVEEFFGEIVVPTEDLATFTRDGKRRITKRKLLPGYIMVNMLINDDTWFLVRETGGISDFTGAAGKPMPMEPGDIERFVNKPDLDEDEEEPAIKTSIPFKVGDRVRVKEGNFENQEGDVEAVDEANGRITVMINIFGRSVPMELDHWQVEPL
ncbi:MAG: transcription termination/antitermination protein NusG [Rubripirellula sp.]